MAYTITNQNMTEINTLIRNYYNMFIVDANKEIFGEMADIGGDRTGSIPSDTTASSYSIQLFQKFIHNVVNNNISSDAISGYSAGTNNGFIKLKTGSSFELASLKFVFACMNIINVFVDILEAYKYFIDNDTSFKRKIQGVKQILLVPSTHRTKEHIDNGLTNITQPNIGYHISTEETKLFLAIKSLNNTSAATINTIFTPINTTESSPTQSITTHGLYNSTTLNITPNYLNQSADNSTSGEFKISGTRYSKKQPSDLFTFDNFQKNTLNNFLLFLATMNHDNARIQVHGLYYYYKYVQLYTTLVFSTMNVALNDSTNDTQHLMKVMQYTPYTAAVIEVKNAAGVVTTRAVDAVNESIKTTPYASDNDIFKDINAKTLTTDFTVSPAVVSGSAKNSAAKIYDNAVRYVYTEIGKLINKLYTASSASDNFSQILINNTIEFDVSNNDNNLELELQFSSKPYATLLNNIQSNQVQKERFINNYVIEYDGYYFKILSLNQNNLKIRGRLLNSTNTSYNTSYEDVNVFAPTVAVASGVYSNQKVKIVPKGLLALRGEYNSGKQYLRELNGEIRYNTSKINAQKNMYKYQQNTDTLLTNQTYAYTVIIGVIVFAVLILSIINVEKQTKQMAGMVFAGIIVLFFIVYYVINAAYIEEFKMKEGFFAISTASGLTSASIDDKEAFLQLQLNSINVRFIEYFQKVMNAIPLTENIDFYSELNGVINSEKNDKTNIKEILEFKRSLGNSSIDMLRYESNRKQIYISTLLVSALIFIILYNVSLYSPSEYRNLIIFAGFIFAIIIFSYYLIFSSKTVRNRSTNKYWGPEFNKDM
jgi:hypothetical protein